MSRGRVITVGTESSHDGRGGDGYDAPVRPSAALLAALLSALLSAPAAALAAAPPPPAAQGQAFALTLKGDGSVLASGPYSLNVPGGSGPLRLELARLAVAGARIRGTARVRNDSGLLLAGLVLDLESASASPKEGSPRPAVPLRLDEPVAFGDLLPGEASPFLPFEAGPLPFGDDVLLVTLLGAVSGLAVEAPVVVEGAVRPVALDSDRSDRLYVATAGAGQVLRLWPLGAGSPAEAARPAASPTGVALRRRNGELWVSTGGNVLEAWTPGRKRPVPVDAGGPAAALRFDAKGRLRAASGNALVAFDGSKPGPPRPLGPPGSRVVSFDVDPKGVAHAVITDGEASRLVVDSPSGASPFAAAKGAGSDVLSAPSACRFDGEGALWVAAAAREPEGPVLARLAGGDGPRPVLSRLALALLLGRDEEAAVPAIVDLAPGTARRTWVLLDDGRVFAARPL